MMVKWDDKMKHNTFKMTLPINEMTYQKNF